MKTKLLVVVMIFTYSLAFAQDLAEVFPMIDGKINYNEVVQVDSTFTADMLYVSAKKWTVDDFRSSKAVIQADDRETKTIILKSYFEKGHNAFVKNPRNWFTIKIECKDGRYRYELYDLKYTGSITMMDYTNEFDYDFEDWATPSEARNKMSEKKRAKLEAELLKYYKELHNRHLQTIESLKVAMAKQEESSW